MRFDRIFTTMTVSVLSVVLILGVFVNIAHASLAPGLLCGSFFAAGRGSSARLATWSRADYVVFAVYESTQNASQATRYKTLSTGSNNDITYDKIDGAKISTFIKEVGALTGVLYNVDVFAPSLVASEGEVKCASGTFILDDKGIVSADTWLAIGDRVRVAHEKVDVLVYPYDRIPADRAQQALGSPNPQPNGAWGTLKAKSATVIDGFWWWDVDFDTGADGWVRESAIIRNDEFRYFPSASSKVTFQINDCVQGGKSWYGMTPVHVFSAFPPDASVANSNFIGVQLPGAVGRITEGPREIQRQFSNSEVNSGPDGYIGKTSTWYKVDFIDNTLGRPDGWVRGDTVKTRFGSEVYLESSTPCGGAVTRDDDKIVKIGDWLEVGSVTNVRDADNAWGVLGEQAVGARGKIIGGPRTYTVQFNSGGYINTREFTMWNVDFHIGVDGWVWEKNMNICTDCVDSKSPPSDSSSTSTPPYTVPAKTCANDWSSTHGGDYDKDGSGTRCDCRYYDACGQEAFSPGQDSWCNPNFSHTGPSCTVAVPQNTPGGTIGQTKASFAIGARVRVKPISVANSTVGVHVRTAPATVSDNTILGEQSVGKEGIVVAGPLHDVNPQGKQRTWWNINFDNSTIDGYVIERRLELVTSSVSLNCQNGTLPITSIPGYPGWRVLENVDIDVGEKHTYCVPVGITKAMKFSAAEENPDQCNIYRLTIIPPTNNDTSVQTMFDVARDPVVQYLHTVGKNTADLPSGTWLVSMEKIQGSDNCSGKYSIFAH